MLCCDDGQARGSEKGVEAEQRRDETSRGARSVRSGTSGTSSARPGIEPVRFIRYLAGGISGGSSTRGSRAAEVQRDGLDVAHLVPAQRASSRDLSQGCALAAPAQREGKPKQASV